jgi:5-methylcytosine-specific restriction endonuclease McrA
MMAIATRRRPVDRRAANRAYYLANRERIRARQAAYTAAHAEENRARARAWELAHPEEARTRKTAAYRANPGLWRARAAAWERANPQYSAWKAARRKYGEVPPYSVWCAIWAAPCALCGTAPARGVDHIIPKAKGGTGAVENLQPACWPCNNRKGAK